MSTTETFIAPGAKLQDTNGWQQSFWFENKELTLKIKPVPLPVDPAPYELTIIWGNELFESGFFSGQLFNQSYSLNLIEGIGVRIILSDWKYLDAITVRLTVIGYVSDTIVALKDERITLPPPTAIV